jgi:hypothetical protein
MQTSNRITNDWEGDVMNKSKSLQLEKELKKLSQLDRIEFRQRMFINNNKRKMIIFIISKYYLIAGLCLMLYSFLAAPHYGDEFFLIFYKLGGDSLKAGVLMIVVEYFASFYRLWKGKKQSDKIAKEYFPKLFGENK